MYMKRDAPERFARKECIQTATVINVSLASEKYPAQIK
jgi:hypothetical protein